MSKKQNLLKGIFSENPVFVLMLGMCPVLGVTTKVEYALGMGVAFTFVLICSNVIISLFRKVIPDEIRIPAFIVIIASLVTIVEMLMQAYVPSLYDSLGLFIPLIVVNCVVLGRAEAFASKNGMFDSAIDALGMGLGFTLGLSLLASIRELFGFGSLMNIQIIPEQFTATIFILAPGAFITLGFLLGIMNSIKNRKANAKA